MELELTFNEQERLFKERTGFEFTTMYEKYYKKLVYYVNGITKDSESAEDISTESFITALEKIDKYDKDKSQFSTWLFRIARNLALQQIKKARKTISLDVEYDEDGTTMKDFIHEEIGDSNTIEVAIKKANVIKSYIEKLKDPYKTVIEMREIHKMSYKDIAEQLDRNLSTIKSQIRNGRHILIENSKKEFNDIDELYSGF